MTTTTKISQQQFQAQVLHSADHLIASIPFLLGFNPSNSVVLLWLSQGKVQLTQRVDVLARNELGGSPEVLQCWANEVTSAARNIAADQVAIAIFAESHRVPTDWWDSITASVCGSAIDRGVYPLGAWKVVEDQWCAFDFGQAVFKDIWQVLDPAIEADIAQDFASAGYDYAIGRSDLESEVLPDRDRQATVLEIMSSDAQLGIALDDEQLRGHLIDEVCVRLGHDDWSNEDVAMTARALTDVRLRDCVLWKLSSESIDPAIAARLRLLVRWVPLGKRAPIATVCAIYAWMLGDGARANISLTLALEDDPDYELGRLLAMALTNAVPPSRWLEMMSSLSFEAVRTGGTPVGNK